MKKSLFILLGYSAVLLLSEILYRYFFKINSLYRISESFLIIFVVLSLFYFSKYRVSRFFIALFFSCSTLINNVHYEVYQNWINGTNYLLMFKEYWEVTHAGLHMLDKLAGGIIWGALDILIFISISRFRQKTHWVADISFILVMGYIFVRSFYTNQELGITSNPGYSRIKANFFAFGYFIGKTLPYDLFNLSNVSVYYRDKPNMTQPTMAKNIVLIMGESLSASNVGTFGYERQTMPFLDQLVKNAPAETLLKPAYSAGLGTAISLPAFFNAIPRPNGLEQIVSGRTNLFRLAKERGYQTYFYSAQPENQMMIMSIMGKTWVDHLLFPSDIGYKRSEGMHDHALLPLFEQIDLSEGNHFIVLHQRGSHAPYAYYLSEEEKAFKENTPLDNYDSTLYNTDQFIEKVFKQLKQHHDDWVLIYTSDYGQFVSNQVYNQGTAKEANYLVPIMTYTENTALQQLQRPFLACDRLFHQQLSTFIIKMLGYDMPISDCQHGVINSLILTGDSGYLEVQANQPPAFFIPKNRFKKE
ncbi:TPA: phosphoethanolamine transferase [Pasteurella multocida]|uniref:sulfatase-like hydrolase/transferase n=1 Tax=Pasteurella multocida TaxID=747 RepID=UPI000233F822|nr:phosphoethanolamine transferase [Pasteurella multocida]AWW59921.1 phosphoethanolamine transferase [Pasteurellaceae bacterium 12591]AET15979.1 protein DcaA [Pasteurella multocida 36950]ANJ90233.1 protein DcaA [Pasteurella multocida subsp. multocida HB01]AON58031.1 protein DcaA [Pasteurella multocida]AUK26477.1 protein DcaA [Pasteurella multocida]